MKYKLHGLDSTGAHPTPPALQRQIMDDILGPLTLGSVLCFQSPHSHRCASPEASRPCLLRAPDGKHAASHVSTAAPRSQTVVPCVPASFLKWQTCYLLKFFFFSKLISYPMLSKQLSSSLYNSQWGQHQVKHGGRPSFSLPPPLPIFPYAALSTPPYKLGLLAPVYKVWLSQAK